MSDPTLKLPIESSFDSRGTDAAMRALRELQQAQAATPKSGGGDPTASFRSASASAQQAERDTLRYASAMAQAQRATGDAAGAVETMRAAQAAMTPNTLEAFRATTQLAQAEATLAKQSQTNPLGSLGAEIGNVAGQVGGLTGQVGALAGSLGTLGAVGAAVGLGKVALDLAEAGSQAARARGSFEGLAQAAHTSGDALLAALRSASHGEINDLNLELTANRANLLGVAKDADTLARLMTVARARGQEFGQTTTEAFDKIVTGIGRTSPRILDDLGFIIQEKDAYTTFAASIGTTADALTEAQKKQAILNGILQQGEETIRATGGAADDAASSLARAHASIDNAKNAIGGLTALKVAPIADDFSKVASAIADVGSAGEALQGLADSATRINPLTSNLNLLGEASDFVVQKLRDLSGVQLPTMEQFWQPAIDSLHQWEDLLGLAPAAADQAVAANQQIAQSSQQAAAATDIHTNATALNATAMSSRAQLLQASAQLIQQEGDVTAASAQQALIDAQNKQAQTAQTELLQAQTMAAVQAFLQLHPSISASGIASMTAAGQISPLIAQLALAAIKAREATAELARFNMMQGLKAATGYQTTGPLGNEAEVRGFKHSAATEDLRQRTAAAHAAQDAEREYQQTVGNYGPALANARAELAQLTQGSAAYIQKETEIARLQQQADAAAKRGKRGDAGVAKLTDQQKLNNSLLADQEKYQNQAEDALAAHEKKLLDIQTEYEKKSLAQQRANEVAKRQSRADFYDSLTSATPDIGQDVAQRISAEYEAAYAKAQEIAQSGNQKLAADYLAMKQRQLADETEYQKKLADAQKAAHEAKSKKDRDAANAEVARLQQIHQMHQEANVEEEKQLLAAGDANAKARDEAVADENARYDEQTAHIQEQADRAADAKVNAAKRGGKAVDDENTKYQKQLDLLHQIKDAAGEIPAAPGGATGESGAPSGGGEAGGEAGADGQGFAGGRRGVSGGSGVEQAIAILQEAAQIIVIIASTVRTNKSLLSLLNQYSQVLTNATTVLTNIADLRARLAVPQAPIDVALIQQMANEQATVVAILASSIVPSIFSAAKWLEKYKDGAAAATDILKGLLDLREQVSKAAAPLNIAVIQQLAAESATVANIVLSALVPLNQQTVDGLKRYQEGAGAAIDILKNMAELTRDLGEPLPPIPKGSMERMAGMAALATLIVTSRLLPTSQATVDALKRYQEGAGAAVDILKDMTDLAHTLTEPIPPIPKGSMERMAGMAALATVIITSKLIPTTQEQTDALKRYQESAGASIAILKDMADLGKDLATVPPAITPAVLTRLADIAAQATKIVSGRMVSVTQEQADAVKRYAETQGAAINVLKNTLDLPAKLFADYQSPTDAQISRVVRDADRVARQINQAAKAYDTKGLEAAKAFSEAIGGTFAAFKDGLLFAQALNSGDFVLDPKNLAVFERGMSQTIAVADRLSKQAAAIPAGNIAALQATAAALTASYDSMIKLAAVPFGNLPQLAGSGGTVNNFYNTFTLPPGTTQQQAQAVLGHLSKQLRMKH